MVGCDDSDSNDADTPQKQCTADKCKDSSVLLQCKDGQTTEVKCGDGKTCTDNACKPVDPADKCTTDTCKDANTLYKCTNGTLTETPCGDGKTCTDNACKSVDPSDKCTTDTCKDANTLYKCTNGKLTETPCGDGKTCTDNACKPVDPNAECTVAVCDENDPKKIKKCENNKFVDALCADGEICEGGGCMKEFEINAACSDPDGYGKCTADGNNAIVCHGNKIRRYTCKAPCKDGEDGIVDCPKKAPKPPEEKECKDSEVMPKCSADKSSVELCQKGKYTTWQCANQSCSVDKNGTITSCDRVADPDALTQGGTYGDPCNASKYQEKCIDKYYALICDTNQKVRIKPAGDCAIDPQNPLKVTYTKAATCDTATQVMPFCINEGKAIGFCSFASDGDSSVGEFLAAQCPSCNGEEDAKACMML